MAEKELVGESDNFRYLTEKYGCEIRLCGSKVTCDPAPVGTDTDYSCYIAKKGTLENVAAHLFDWGYMPEGDEHYQTTDTNKGFTSWRNGKNINLIVTADLEFYEKHKVATELCRRLNLLNKADRVLVFQTILYGNVDYNKCELVAA